MIFIGFSTAHALVLTLSDWRTAELESLLQLYCNVKIVFTFKHYFKKTYGGVKAKLHIFWISALNVGEWQASRPGRFTPDEGTPGAHWVGPIRDGGEGIPARTGIRTPVTILYRLLQCHLQLTVFDTKPAFPWSNVIEFDIEITVKLSSKLCFFWKEIVNQSCRFI